MPARQTPRLGGGCIRNRASGVDLGPGCRDETDRIRVVEWDGSQLGLHAAS